MSVERAVVQFVADGVPDVEGAGDRVVKVNADVEASADKAKDASTSAKEAADEAQKSAANLSGEITHTLHLLHQASRLAETIARASGVEEDSGLGEGIEIAGAGASGAFRGARVGGQIGGPVGAAIGTLVGGVAGIAEKVNEIHKKQSERDEKLKEFDQKQKDREIVDEMVRHLGLAKADAAWGGARRVE